MLHRVHLRRKGLICIVCSLLGCGAEFGYLCVRSLLLQLLFGPGLALHPLPAVLALPAFSLDASFAAADARLAVSLTTSVTKHAASTALES